MLLLDTCAMIWFGNRQPIAQDALDRIEDTANRGGVLISIASAWEIGLLAMRARSSNAFVPDPVTWFATVMAAPGIEPARCDATIAIMSSSLIWDHRDPVDRWLVATARAMRVPIVTRDRIILDYAAAGHVEAVPC